MITPILAQPDARQQTKSSPAEGGFYLAMLAYRDALYLYGSGEISFPDLVSAHAAARDARRRERGR